MTYKNRKNKETKDKYVHLPSFFKSIQNPILEIDLRGNVIYANKTAQSLISKIKRVKRKHPFLNGLVSCAKKLRKSKNKYFEREIEADGRWYTQNILLDDSNHLHVFCCDITDYKLVADTLKESENRYRTMIEYSNDMIWTLDKKGKFLFFNKRAEEITGYKLKDHIGKSFTHLVLKEDLSRLVKIFKKTVSGESIQYEVTIFSKNKQMISLLVNSAPLLSKGVIIGTISFGKNITEYRKTEKALKESEEKYRDLYEEAPDAYYSIGTDGRILKANKRASELYGLSNKNLIGKFIYEMYANTPTGKVKAKEILNKFLSGEKIKGEELEMRRVNGKITWISLSIKPIRDANGNIIASRSIAIDITERKETEKALEDSNDFLENLLAYANAPIIVWDPKFNITRFNHAFEALTGRTANKIIGKPLKILFPKELVNEYMNEIKKTATGERWETVEIKILHINGSIRTVLWNSATLFAADGKTPTATIAQGQDITDRKKMERSALELKDRDEAILTSIGDAVFAIDKNGMIMLFNKMAEQLSGVTTKEATGRNYKQVVSFVVEQEEKLDYDFIDESNIENEKTRLAKYRVLVRKDNVKIPIACIASPINTASGETIGTVVIFRDVTKEREIDKAKTEFVSLASHQLRTPLSSINWYTEMLLTGNTGKINGQQKKYLNEVYASCKRMVELVNALLNVSRLELGAIAIDPGSIDIVRLAKDVIDEIKQQIEEKNIKLNEIYDEKLPLFNADPKLLRMIFQNLLSNSVKYTPDNGKITFEIGLSESNILFKISDTGYGIPEVQQDKIFTKFFRADNIREKDTEGTGLGLYIVKTIIDHSGGKIWFKSHTKEHGPSHKKQGTIFYIAFPLAGMKKRGGTKTLI